jgi:hypothetical protein
MITLAGRVARRLEPLGWALVPCAGSRPKPCCPSSGFSHPSYISNAPAGHAVRSQRACIRAEVRLLSFPKPGRVGRATSSSWRESFDSPWLSPSEGQRAEIAVRRLLSAGPSPLHLRPCLRLHQCPPRPSSRERRLLASPKRRRSGPPRPVPEAHRLRPRSRTVGRPRPPRRPRSARTTFLRSAPKEEPRRTIRPLRKQRSHHPPMSPPLLRPSRGRPVRGRPQQQRRRLSLFRQRRSQQRPLRRRRTIVPVPRSGQAKARPPGRERRRRTRRSPTRPRPAVLHRSTYQRRPPSRVGRLLSLHRHRRASRTPPLPLLRRLLRSSRAQSRRRPPQQTKSRWRRPPRTSHHLLRRLLWPLNLHLHLQHVRPRNWHLRHCLQLPPLPNPRRRYR